ncbi:hypothetical protein ACIOWF_01130 [Cellulosimicrobium cellulans]|uniref:hypothetical protein n=1 Tax=Cellulosimicrobium cellulans TaxID=1710 RepID=UPI003811C2D1
MDENRIAISADDRVLLDDGTAVVLHVDRAGIEVRDVRGEVAWIEWPDLGPVDPIVGGDPAEAPALRSFADEWNRLDAEARAEAMFRLGVVQEVTTGFRHGHLEFALPGEPSGLFDPGSGHSLTVRCQRMAERLGHEARIARGGNVRGSVSVRTVHMWIRQWENAGLLGLVDGRRAKRVEVFSTIPLAWRSVAHEVVAEFDGDVSTVNLREVHRRIKVRLKELGHVLAVPQRAAGRYVSHLMRAQGETTRAQRSNKLRGVSGTQSFPALLPGQIVAIDVTRSDVMVWCPVRGSACSVEIISAIDVATRMILALRVVPLSADSHDASLLMYDVLRPFSQIVDGTTITDWAWAGVPERIEFYVDDADTDQDCSGVEVSCPRTCRSLRTAPGLQGEHTVPGVRPIAVRADHGSIFVSQIFRDLLGRLGIDLALSRTRRPIDDGILERWHETLQRGLQQLPSFKGRNVSERGRMVGVGSDDGPLLTAVELERFLRRWVALDYHRSPHSGLHLPSGERVDMRPVDMFDALLKISGRIHVPQRPDLIYDFLPSRWGTVGQAGVEFADLVYDGPELDGLRMVPVGTFRPEDRAMPFFYDPHDVSRVWFRHPEAGRVVEVPWRKAHMIEAPLTETLLQHVRGEVRRRKGGPRLAATVAEDEIIAEVGTLLTGIVPKAWRKRVSAATMRRDAAKRDHDEAKAAMLIAEVATAHPAPLPAQERGATAFSIFAESWPFTPPDSHDRNA